MASLFAVFDTARTWPFAVDEFVRHDVNRYRDRLLINRGKAEDK